MSNLAFVLKLGAPVFFLVGALHLSYGLEAEVLLGATIPVDAISDPVLDSQNRFYGVSFTLFGVLLFLCSTDIPKYATVLRCVIWVFFAAGIARFVSIGLYGLPSALVLLLLASEVLLPPLLEVWLRRALSEI
jgi:Domain of unknown function (DUF4345)